jgi:acyl-CoA synthetase (AMP-forming)/AMP-acid ligase II
VTLATLLVEHPFPDDAPLLHSPDTTLSAGAARRDARAVAARLRAAGVGRGHAVAVQLPGGPGAITAMFGVWLAGAVFVPVNPRSPAGELRTILEATRPAVLLTGTASEGNGPELLPEARVYDPGVAFVTWTSGTTGAPKPVLHTHVNYLELLDRVLAPLRGSRPKGDADRRPTPNLVPVSLALNAGIYNVLFGLRAGAEVVVMDRFDPRTFADLVGRFSIRSTVLPPAAMTMLSDDPTVVDLAPLRYVRSITAPLSPLQARRFAAKFGVVVLNGYGQAEIGEVIGWTAADAREHPDKLGAVGRPHPGVAIKIAPEPDGAAAEPTGRKGQRDRPTSEGGGARATHEERAAAEPTNQIGRLLVRPPSTAVGIAADRVDAEGYIDTGDLARVDDDGFVWIEGRAGDVINRGGNKVFPEHVEEVLRLVPGVTEAAVAGVRDERLGEVPVAYIVTAFEVSDDNLVEVCRAHLAPYKIPVAFRRVAALPRSEVGKVLRRELAQLQPEPPS